MSINHVSNKIDQSYQTAVHIAYAIVLTQTFESISKIFGSPTDFIFNTNNATVLYLPFALMSYTVFITSWIGYARSISNHGYKYGIFGTARFLTDLFIVFLIYELLIQTNSNNVFHYVEMFILLPMIYFVYTVWDFLKYGEHRGKDVIMNKTHKRRRSITISYTLSFLFIIVMYIWIPVIMVINSFVNPTFTFFSFIDWKKQMVSFNDYWWNVIFAVITVILTIFYRKAKWEITQRKLARVSQTSR